MALSCAVLAAGTLTAATVTTASTAGAVAVSEMTRPSKTGVLAVHWRGNGHGHGMSQYGAQGAALAGRTARQILSFYYPGTTLTTVSPSWIRVRLSNPGTRYTRLRAGTIGLTLSGYGRINQSGYSSFRLVPEGSGLRLVGLTARGWKIMAHGLGSTATFSSSSRFVRVMFADGSSTRYRGTVSAVRSGAGEITVNRLPLDSYVAGVVPREMPASWKPAALQAQAVAARSYAETTRASASGGYDICDTTSCQEYGGMVHYTRSGLLAWQDDPAALAGNANMVLRYHRAPVFAQYSASNGGATVDGGEPYLVARSDPYDAAASGDPYLNQVRAVRSSSLAAYYGLRTVTGVQVTSRDGNGPWRGRVVTAWVYGTDSAGKATRIATDGESLGAATGAWTDYLLLANR